MVFSPLVPKVLQPALKLLFLPGVQLLNRGIGGVFSKSSFQGTSGCCGCTGVCRADAFSLGESQHELQGTKALTLHKC